MDRRRGKGADHSEVAAYMITIYSPTETDFSTNGIAALAPSVCVIAEGLNGDYQLQMDHPVDAGGIWKTIEEDCILRVPSPRGADLFRISRTDKSISRMRRVYARHLTYDLLTDFIKNSAPTNASAIAALNTALAGTGFAGTSDVAGDNSVRWVRKNPLACIMGDDDNSIVQRWGGEVERLGNRISVLARLGADRGVSIRYRKNLTGLDMSADISGVITRIMPTGLKEDGQTVLELPETFVDSPLIGNYAKIRTKHLHYGDIKIGDDYPTEAEAFAALRERAQGEFDAGLDKPAVSAKVSFIDLSQTIEYAEYRQLERVALGDTVHVWHSGIGVDMTARVVSATWDCLRERYTSITIGQEGVNFNAVVNQQNKQVAKQAEARADELQVAIDEATQALLSPGDSYVRFLPSLSNPAEILIMDAPNAEDAVDVMRLNKSGWGLSTSGVNGPYGVAATAQGMVADFMTTGTLNAALVKIMGNDGTFWDNNYIQITDKVDSQRIMRFGRYDGDNSGLALSRDGGTTWEIAANYDGLQYAEMFQLMLSGYIKLGGIEMDGGDHPYISMKIDDFLALYIGEGNFEINQVLTANGHVFFPNLRTTTLPPNLRWIDGELFVSSWTPSTGGSDPDPGPGGSSMIISITASPASATVGTTITWSASAMYANGTVRNWRCNIYNPSGSIVAGNASSSVMHTVNATGTWYVEFFATDDNGQSSSIGGYVEVSSSGSSGGTSYAGTVTGTQVSFRLRADGSSSTTYPYYVSAPQRLATRAPYRAVDGPGGNGKWWPVMYVSNEPDEYPGYVSDMYFSPD